MKNMLKMVVVLSFLCAFSGLALSSLKDLTAPLIEEQVLLNVQGPAVVTVFPRAENQPIAERQKFSVDGREITVFPSRNGGKLTGIALEQFGKGYGGDIGVVVGFNVHNDTLAGIGITTLKETPGLGMRVTEPGFGAQFVDMKPPAGLKSDGGAVDGISGATISSKGVVSAVNDAVVLYGKLKEQLLQTWK